jgi:small subunit ribosomal protein S8
MSMTDPIADLLTRIRNAVAARHESVVVPGSRLKMQIVQVLKNEGFIESFREVDESDGGKIRIFLRYDKENRGVIRGVRRISRPSRRIYVGRDSIPYVRDGLGVAILTTPRGILTDREARSEGVGGEVICFVW